jgi:hypothetical protein
VKVAEDLPERPLWRAFLGSGWGFVAFAFVLRLAFALASGTLLRHPNNYSIRIIDGEMQDFADVGFQPLGGYLLSRLLWLVVGKSEAAFGLAFCLIGTALVPLLVRLRRNLGILRDRAHELIAGWAAAAFPPLIMLSGTWRYMMFPVLLSLAAITVASDGADRSHPGTRSRRLAAAAVLTGGVLWTRPDYVLPSFALLVRRFGLGARTWVAAAGSFGLAALVNLAAIGAPWSSGNLWYNAFAGNNSVSREAELSFGVTLDSHEQALFESLRRRGVAPPQSDGASFRALLSDEIRADWAGSAERLLFKLGRVFDWKRDSAYRESPIENLAYSGSVLPCVLAGLTGLGIMLASDRARRAADVLLVVAGYALPMVLIFPIDRLKIPLQAVLLLLATCTIRRLVDPVHPHRRGNLVPIDGE